MVENVKPHSSHAPQPARHGALEQEESSPWQCVCHPGPSDKSREVVKGVGPGAQNAGSYTYGVLVAPTPSGGISITWELVGNVDS